MDQIREYMLTESGSGVLWANTLPTESENLPRAIVLVWNLADREAVHGLLHQLNRPDLQHYFHLAVTSGMTGPSMDEVLDAFTEDLDR